MKYSQVEGVGGGGGGGEDDGGAAAGSHVHVSSLYIQNYLYYFS